MTELHSQRAADKLFPDIRHCWKFVILEVLFRWNPNTTWPQGQDNKRDTWSRREGKMFGKKVDNKNVEIVRKMLEFMICRFIERLADD